MLGSISAEMPDTRLVSRDFLAAMGTRVIAGRRFREDYRAGHPAVTLVNETLVRRGLFGGHPIGKQFYALGPSRGKSSVIPPTHARVLTQRLRK